MARHVKTRRNPIPATALVALLAAISVTGASAATPLIPASASPADQVARGKYLADAGDCAACHTADGGRPFAGGLGMNSPFGVIMTPNITPDRDTGIGGWSDDEFYRVFHEGIGKGGEHLYPAMPFPWYTKVTRDDVLAIKAYLFTLEPVHAPKQPNRMAFPFNVRAGLAAWDEAFLKVGTFESDPKQSAEVNRGAYLVQGLGHCGECHNGNSLLGNAKMSDRLQGGEINNWYAPNITSDMQTGIGRYTDAQVFTYLKTGAEPHMGVVAGPMAQTLHESLQKLTDPDLHAIVAYLKSTPAEADTKTSHPAEFASVRAPGAGTYLNFCASCHQANGKGLEGAIPALAGNGAVLAGGPQTIIRVILGGLEAQTTYGPMPSVGSGMTDQQVADVANYVRQSWGNAAPPTAAAGMVGDLRKITHTLLTGTLPSGCPSIADTGLKAAIEAPGGKIADTMKSMTLATVMQSVDTMLAQVKAADPQAKQADIINSLTIAYCPVVAQDKSLSAPQKAAELGQFSQMVYTQLADGGKN